MNLGDCGENQVWNTCARACEPHCKNFNGDKCGLFMTLQCVQQCSCKEGYLRITENTCAPTDSAECGGEYSIVDDPQYNNHSN